MNKKGFTLVELLLVIVIIGIVGAVTIPNIMEALSESKAEGGESVEKILKQNLELYNKDNEEDLWCLEEENESCTETNPYYPSIEELYNMNPDIDMGECLLKNDKSLVISRGDNGKYTYTANIICSKDFDSNNKKIADEQDENNGNIYYDSSK